MLKTAAAFLCLFLFSSNAFAHPLITDDTTTLGKGKFQLEINSEFSTDTKNGNGISIKETGSTIAAALSGGIRKNIDLVIGLPLQCYTIREADITAVDEHGIGDITVELKWRLLESEESGMSLALKPGLSLPTGNEKKGIGNGAVSGGIALIATHEGRLGAVHCNVAYRRNAYGIEENHETARNDIWQASMAAELNLTGSLRSVLNISVESGNEKAQEMHPAFLLGGLIYSVSGKLDLDVGLKCGLNESETDSAVLAGVAARF
jgi:hypothetical protein